MLTLSKMLLLTREIILKVLERWMNTFIWLVEFLWIKYPINLLLDLFVQSIPLFCVIFGWEWPEYFLQAFIENWVPEFIDVHGHHEQVDEIESKRYYLLLINTDTQHVTDHEVISEDLKLEEEW